jgi:predicted transposase YdaD
MAFNSTCKFLAESFSSDFAAWLIGKPIAFSKLSPSELSLEPIRADALILLDSEDLILHIGLTQFSRKISNAKPKSLESGYDKPYDASRLLPVSAGQPD